MELVTAVISGDRNFELRVFMEGLMSVDHEQVLTRRLCRLVNIFHEDWKRLDIIGLRDANRLYIIL